MGFSLLCRGFPLCYRRAAGMENVVGGIRVERTRRGLVDHASKILQVVLQIVFKAAARTEFFADIPQDTQRRVVINVDINARLPGSLCWKVTLPSFCRPLTDFQPIWRSGIQFSLTASHSCWPTTSATQCVLLCWGSR